MIAIELQDNNRCEIFDSGKSIGYISVGCNSFYAQNSYLKLEIAQYDMTNAKEMFALLRSKLSRPLQVMLYSRECEKRDFLISGGFQRKRQCYELEVSAKELTAPVKESVPITESERGESSYKVCCELLYQSYAKIHNAINPLTADMESFCQNLPNKVLLCQENGTIKHFAFIDESEIAYIGTVSQSDYHCFAQTLLFRMLAQYSSISFECDDCDPAAMELKAFFRTAGIDSYDTYILG